jgi:hypothetical protein
MHDLILALILAFSHIACFLTGAWVYSRARAGLPVIPKLTWPKQAADDENDEKPKKRQML